MITVKYMNSAHVSISISPPCSEHLLIVFDWSCVADAKLLNTAIPGFLQHETPSFLRLTKVVNDMCFLLLIQVSV